MGMARPRGRRRRRPFLIVAARPRFFWSGVAFLSLLCLLVLNGISSAVSESGLLAGQVIYIDPGHGGIDPGACGQKYLEKDIALNVALYLGARLQKSGARVVYTRTGDYDLQTDEVDDLSARIRLIHSSKATLVVSIHCNSFTDSAQKGAQTFYNASGHPGSRQLATLIQSELKKATGTYREASSRLDHFILNHATVPAVTVELGFLSNPGEEKLLGSHWYQQKLAECIFKGIISFVNSSL